MEDRRKCPLVRGMAPPDHMGFGISEALHPLPLGGPGLGSGQFSLSDWCEYGSR